MKLTSDTLLSAIILLCIVFKANSQSNTNWTLWQGYYNQSKAQLCAIVSSDGLSCLQCLPNLTNAYTGFCQLQWPVDNCYAMDYCWNCMLCHQGYYVNYSTTYINTCVSKTVGCLNYDNGTNLCLKCLPGWVMNITANPYLNQPSESYCYFVPDKNCITYVNQTNCTVCVSGYVPFNNVCTQMLPFCTSLGGNGSVCQKCMTNYELNSSANCVPIAKILNCQQQVDYTCSSCLTGYNLTNNVCVYFIANCQVVNGTICNQCAIGYQVMNSSCILILPNCAIMNGLVCQTCLTNFEVNSLGNCSAIAKVANCQTQVNYTCQSCTAGYNLVNNGCVANAPNCIVVNGSVCTQCASGYRVSPQGICMAYPISNCASQINANCNSCASGYTLTNNTCIYTIANCLQVTAKSCIVCASGYSLSNNTCIVQLPNCLTISGQFCVTCAPGYIVSLNGQCISVPVIPNCSLQIGLACAQCVTGFTLSKGICSFSIDHCLQVDSSNKCAVCNSFFYLTNDGTCQQYDPNCKLFDTVVFSNCLQCSNGFFLNSNSVCQQVDPLCKSYNNSTGLCLTCYVGYTLTNATGKCQIISSINASTVNNCNQYDFVNNICKVCAQGCYFDSAGICQQYNDLNCKIPSNDSKSCLECYQGYLYNTASSKCELSTLICSSWIKDVCASCPSGYYLDISSNCILVDPLCKLFNPTTKLCYMCYPGYGLDTNNTCRTISTLPSSTKKYIENCASFNAQNQCQSCYFGWYVAQDNVGSYCLKVSDLCRTYNISNGNCTSCYLGYYLTLTGTCQTYY